MQLAANRTAVKSGKAVILTDSLTVSKFDTKQTDQLYANATRRSQQLLPKELMEARARQQQIAEAQFERQQQQSMDATQRRLQQEQQQRDEEARRERNRTRDPNSRGEYVPLTWPKPPWAK